MNGSRLTAAPAPTESLWSAKRVAEHLDVSVKTVYRLPIPCVSLGRRIRRYLPSVVSRFVSDRLNVAP